jgi:hypothetical protein
MLATAKAKLPNFNFNNMNGRDIQGAKCSYAPEATAFFLQ